ncbi:cell division ATPase MinD [Haloterrigena turkmenica DSM 5511]|uniref:Cell division ATPase MinD n=1 Tax=Haloterrigena turkmenica (strain ATCC 51198 / DSM 5511 / JCM 9101 / NCIMB 13204 / VKM B-1734 / 4k) TaxID=543526 RepID=D2RZJ9_HALTV|nr:cell division ATPase MinD [Haloterrigena turkmenica]ADB62038.1 cell division ATPase MinD [Haloterrigena turkmenica DSM 5511]
MSHETVYAIASGKGGVGKTTTTVNLGTALAQAGERVAIVDADLGMANLAGFVSLTPDSTTLHDVLSGDASVDDATYRITDNIVAVPSGTSLDEYADTSPEGLREVVEDLRERFDYVFLDVGAGVSHETVLPLGLADAVVLVSTPEPAAVHDSKKTLELTERAGGEVSGLVVTRTRPDSDVSYEEIAARLETPLLATIPDDPAARESVYAGTPLVVYEPDGPAAGAYRQLAADLAGIEVADTAVDAESESAAADSADSSDDPTDEESTEREAAHDDVSSAITEAESDT